MKKILFTVSIAALVGCLMLPTLSEAGAVNNRVIEPGNPSGGNSGGTSPPPPVPVLTGRVTDKATGVGLAGVGICMDVNDPQQSIMDPDGGTKILSVGCPVTTTNANGDYSTTTSYGVTYDIWFTTSGYKAKGTTYDQPQGTYTLNFATDHL